MPANICCDIKVVSDKILMRQKIFCCDQFGIVVLQCRPPDAAVLYNTFDIKTEEAFDNDRGNKSENQTYHFLCCQPCPPKYPIYIIITKKWYFHMKFFFLAVPLRREGQQALQVASSLSHSKTLLKNAAIEHFERLVTLETCDQSDEET